MVIHAFSANHFKLDGGAMFGVVPKTIWNKLNPADELNYTRWVCRCLLIELGDRLILFDTGIGLKQDAKFWSHFDVNPLDDIELHIQNLGYSSSEVTDVVFTHLHFDHCGGAVRWNSERTLLEPAFKNAHFWTNESHWRWATYPNAREKASFLKENLQPIKDSGQLIFLEPKDVSPFKGIEFIYVNGHTEQQMLPLINYKNRKILFTADLFPSLAHLPIPYVMSYDTRPLLTMQEKEDVLKQALANDWILCFGHDHQYEACTLMMTEKGIRAKEIFSVKEI